MRTAVNLVRLYGLLSAPIIPGAADTILAAVAPDDERGWPDDVATELTRLQPGTPFAVPEVLFRKLTDDELAAWEERFGGDDE
jgi:methionyl-tRNA synthetase